MKVICNKIIPFGSYGAINLFGVVFHKPDMAMGERTLRHEMIHTFQMRELLYLPFYILYVAEWLLRIIQKKGNAFQAYRAISFEREAYANDGDRDYLRKRKHYAQWRK